MNVPNLRFQEFSGQWEEKKLDEITFGGMYGLNAAAKDFDGVNKYIRITDIDENSNNFVPNPLCSPEGNLDDKFLLNENDLVFARTGASTGKSYLYKKSDGKLYFAGFLIKFHVNKAISKFVFYHTLRTQYDNWVKIMSVRSGQPGINAEEYKKLELKFPTIQEQQKIASFLSKIDEKIEKLVKKQELWETYKKGMMQQIFSQNLRFKDENGEDYPDWEEKEAKEIFQNYSNKNHNGDLPILAVTQNNGVVDRNLVDIDIKTSPKSAKSYKIVEPGNFVISLRSFQGGIEYSEIKGVVSPAYTVLKSNIPICDDFYKPYFKKENFISKLNSAVIGIREGKQISYSVFSEMMLPYPSLGEQEKIAELISVIDYKIGQVIKELQLNKEFKKGLLQQMFC